MPLLLPLLLVYILLLFVDILVVLWSESINFGSRHFTWYERWILLFDAYRAVQFFKCILLFSLYFISLAGTFNHIYFSVIICLLPWKWRILNWEVGQKHRMGQFIQRWEVNMLLIKKTQLSLMNCEKILVQWWMLCSGIDASCPWRPMEGPCRQIFSKDEKLFSCKKHFARVLE